MQVSPLSAVLFASLVALGCGGGAAGTAAAAGSDEEQASHELDEQAAADAGDRDGADAGAAAASEVAPAEAARTAPRVLATRASPYELDVPDGAKRGCDRERYRAPAEAKLELRAVQAASGRAVVNVALRNAGPSAVCITSHIQTHELQSDWLRLQYSDGAKYHHVPRVLELNDARDKSAPFSVLLAPGATLWTSIDLDQWAQRSRNGAEPLPAGSLYAEAIYDTTGRTDVWAGRLVSAPFELKVP